MSTQPLAAILGSRGRCTLLQASVHRSEVVKFEKETIGLFLLCFKMCDMVEGVQGVFSKLAKRWDNWQKEAGREMTYGIERGVTLI